MARQLIIELVGDSSKLTKSLGEAETSTSSFSDKLGKIGVVAGGSLAAAGVAITALAGPIEQSHAELEAALKNAGTSFDNLKGPIGDAVGHMETFGHGSADTQEALAKLTTKLGDPKQALADLSTVAEVAAVKHISLASAADLVGKASDGNAKTLKQFGIVVQAGVDPVQALGTKLKGVAENEANTFGGKIDALKTKLGDMAGNLGQTVGPAITAIGPALAGLPVLFDGVAAAGGAMGTALEIATGPIGLIVIGIAATGLALYEAYQHFGPFHTAVNDLATIISTVFGGIKTFVSTTIGDVVGIFSDFPGKIGGALKGIADVISAPFKLGFDLLATAWNDTLGSFHVSVPDIPGLPGRGTSFGFGKMPILDSGGIVSKPTLALLAANSQPEAVVPLSRAGGAVPGGGTTYQITVNSLDPRTAGDVVVSAIKRYELNNGSGWRAA